MIKKKCLLYLVPEKNEDSFTVGHAIDLLIIVQEWLNCVNESLLQLVHLIKYKYGSRTAGNISTNPQLYLILKD